MTEKTELEWLKEVEEALDFQMIVCAATGTNSISLKKEHAYIFLMAVKKMISELERSENEHRTDN